MNQNQNNTLSRIIVLLNSLLVLHQSKRKIDVPFKSYIAFMERRVKTQGPRSAIKFLKEVHLLCVKHAIGLPYLPLPWTKSDSKGFPKVLTPLRPFLEGSGIEKRIGLTVSKWYSQLMLKADLDTSSITNSNKGNMSISKKWTDFLRNEFQKKFRPIRQQWDWVWHKTTKNGPNGPALLTSIADLVALEMDHTVMKNLTRYMGIVSPRLLDHFTELRIENKTQSLPNLTHSKLAFLPEGGGKTRVIAIGDYFTQEALLPLHREVMGFLKDISTDGTYDQERSIKLIKRALKDNKSLYSLDLTSATDRMPVSLQVDVLSSIYGKEFAEAWKRLLTERAFSVADRDTKVHYAVGQPMGFYSSWAVFALTHHAIIQYVASRVGLHQFQDYTLLGDDICIFDRTVARKYHNFLTRCGVDISIAKSFSYEPGDKNIPPHAEFAKQLIVEHGSLTPIPAEMMLTWSKNPVKEFPGLQFALIRSDLILPETPLLNFVNELPLTKRENVNLHILVTAPDTLSGAIKRTSPERFSTGPGVGPWEGLDLNLIPAALIDILSQEYLQKYDKLWNSIRAMSHYGDLVDTILQIGGTSSVIARYRPLLSMIPLAVSHPLVQVIQGFREKIVFASLKSERSVGAKIDLTRDINLWKKVLEISDDYFGSFRSQSHKISRAQSMMTLKIFRMLKNGYKPKLTGVTEEDTDKAISSPFWEALSKVW